MGDLGLDFPMDDLDDLDGMMLPAPPAVKKATQKTETKSGAPVRCCGSQHKVSESTCQYCSAPQCLHAAKTTECVCWHAPANQQQTIALLDPLSKFSPPAMERLSLKLPAADWQDSLLAASRLCRRPAQPVGQHSQTRNCYECLALTDHHACCCLSVLPPAGSDWNGTSLLRDSAQHTSNPAEHEDDVMGPDRTDAAQPGAEASAAAPAEAPGVSAEVPARPEDGRASLLDGHQQQQLQEEQLQMQLEGEPAGDSGAVLGQLGDAGGMGGAGADGIGR